MTTGAIYLDHQATTPLDDRVRDAMLPWLSEPANPHATHAAGRRAADAVEEARHHVGRLLGADPDEIVFTANATEAANIAIRGVLPHGGRAVSSPIEHPCVRETLAAPELHADVEIVPIGTEGVLDPALVEEAMERATDLVAVMAVNNEIGTIQPFAEIGRLCEFQGVPFLCDIVQAVGRVDIDVVTAGIGLAPISSHKLYGPVGVGALFVRRDLQGRLSPLTTGGGQERGMRAGTLPTALCVGFGRACQIASAERLHDWDHASEMATILLDELRRTLGVVVVNGSEVDRIPHNLNLAFPDIDADALLASMPELLASTGSACSAGALDRSHVLIATGTSAELADSSIRFGFGRGTTADEVKRAASMVTKAASTVNAASARRTAGGGLG